MSARSARMAVAALALVALTAGAGADAGTGTTPVTLEKVVDSGLRLGDVVVAGDRLLLVAETSGTIRSSALDGSGLRPFAKLPRRVEEMRCRIAPAGHGFAAGELWCHTPDNRIYRVAGDGTPTLVARLPEPGPSDGALAFDTVGRFGWRLLAVTGSSGSGVPGGGNVYAVAPDGGVERLAGYAGPGGADNVLVAPPTFGARAGDLLIAIDHLPQEGGVAASEGRLVALAPDGSERTLARARGVGFNGIAAVPASAPTLPGAGLLLTETFSHVLWRVPDAALRRYAGGVVVSGESRLWLVAVTPRAGGGYAVRRIPTGPAPRASVNFEGAAYLG